MIKTVTEATFKNEVLDSQQPVLVDLWAAWCGPCMAMEPTMKEIADDFEGKMVVAKLNVDENPNLAQELDVMSIPTMLLFKGGKPVQRIVGSTTKDRLAGALNAALA